jgi:hypothetical protein
MTLIRQIQIIRIIKDAAILSVGDRVKKSNTP